MGIIESYGDWRDVTDEMRAEAELAAHPRCELCGQRGCLTGCCGLQVLVRDPEDEGIVMCECGCEPTASIPEETMAELVHGSRS